MERRDEIWKTEELVRTYLEGVRGGIPFAKEQFDIMLHLVKARDEAVEWFLDLGCGDGALAYALLSQYPSARGVLVDFSEPMLRKAEEKLISFGGQITFVLADFGLKEWVAAVQDYAPLDVVLSGYAIHHQPDQRKLEIYQEVFSLLKPGGLFINMEHVASPSLWLTSVYDEFFIDRLHAFHQQQGVGKSREQVAVEYVHRPDKSANLLAPVDLQCQWLREIGFEDVDCYFKVFELAIFGGRKGGNSSSKP